MSGYNGYHRQWYQAHKAEVLQYNRETKALRRKLHLCVVCGTKDAYTMNGRSRCAECVRKDTEYCRKKRGYNAFVQPQDRPEKPWKNRPRGANGYCWQCNKRQNVPGRNLCAECYEKKVKNMEMVNAKRSEWCERSDA